MHRLELDFVGKARSTRDRLVRTGLLGTGILLALAVGRADILLEHRLEEQRDDLQRLSGGPAPANRPRPAQSADQQRELKRAAAVLDDLELPWEQLLGAIEGAGTNGLGLLGLAPDAPSKSLRITGEAKSLDEVINYIDRLAHQSALFEVHLVSYAPIQDGTLAGIQFVIEARWKQS